MPRPQFRLRSLFILTAIVAVGVWLGPLMMFSEFWDRLLAGICALSVLSGVVIWILQLVGVLAKQDSSEHPINAKNRASPPNRPPND
jgi:hypothetical protein